MGVWEYGSMGVWEYGMICDANLEIEGISFLKGHKGNFVSSLPDSNTCIISCCQFLLKGLRKSDQPFLPRVYKLLY